MAATFLYGRNQKQDRSVMCMREMRLPSKQIVSCSKNVSKAQKDYGCSCSKKINCAELLRLRITADVNQFSRNVYIARICLKLPQNQRNFKITDYEMLKAEFFKQTEIFVKYTSKFVKNNPTLSTSLKKFNELLYRSKRRASDN